MIEQERATPMTEVEKAVVAYYLAAEAWENADTHAEMDATGDALWAALDALTAIARALQTRQNDL